MPTKCKREAEAAKIAKDDDPFDGFVKCKCDSEYGGDYCNVNHTLIAVMSLAGVVLVLVLLASIYRYNAVAAKRAAHNFHAELEKMLAEGEIEPDQLLASKLAATPGGRIAPSIGTTGSLGGSMPQLRRGTGGGGGGGGADATDANPQYILQATSEQGKSSQPIYNADDGQAIAAAAGAGGGGGGGDAAGAGGRAEDPYTTYTVPATRGMDNGAYEHTPTTVEEDEHPYMQPTTPLDAADASGGSAPASTGDEHPYMQPTLPLRAAGIVAPEESNYLRTDEDTQSKTVIIAGLPTGPPPPRPKTAFVDPNIRVAQRLKARNASMATVVVVNGLFTVTLPQKSSGTRMVVLASAVPSEPSGGKIEIYDKKGKTSNTLPVKTIRVKNIQSVGKSINKKQETCLTVEDKSNPGNLFFFAPGKDANLVEELHTFISARHGSGGSSSITAFSNSETRL
eukprot:gene16967-29572_t